MKKIDSNHKRKLSEWRRIFDEWSEKMDELYPITEKDKGKQYPERNDVTRWGDNPAQWMKPYDDEIYNAWCEYDNGMFDINLLGDKIVD